MNEFEIILKYIQSDLCEDEIMEIIMSNIDNINFSDIISHFGYFEGNTGIGDSKSSIINYAIRKRHHCVMELLLKKYYEYDSTTLTNVNNGRASHICCLMTQAIDLNDIDSVEILLKYVTNINELNNGGLTYIEEAIGNYIPNVDIIELLTLSGA